MALEIYLNLTCDLFYKSKLFIHLSWYTTHTLQTYRLDKLSKTELSRCAKTNIYNGVTVFKIFTSINIKYV